MQKHSELLTRRQSGECGCPEEEWLIGMFNVIIHIEPDGRGDIFVDCGDWQSERTVECDGIESLRSKAANWIYSIPASPNM